MSFLYAAPDFVAAAATDLASIGSSINAASVAAAAPTTRILAAGSDEVSTAIAGMFAAHAQAYQALSTQADLFHAQFVQLLNSGASAYTGAEAANASPLQPVLDAVNAPSQALTGRPLIGNGADGAAGTGQNGGDGGWLIGSGGRAVPAASARRAAMAAPPASGATAVTEASVVKVSKADRATPARPAVTAVTVATPACCKGLPETARLEGWAATAARWVRVRAPTAGPGAMAVPAAPRGCSAAAVLGRSVATAEMAWVVTGAAAAPVAVATAATEDFSTATVATVPTPVAPAQVSRHSARSASRARVMAAMAGMRF